MPTKKSAILYTQLEKHYNRPLLLNFLQNIYDNKKKIYFKKNIFMELRENLNRFLLKQAEVNIKEKYTINEHLINYT